MIPFYPTYPRSCQPLIDKIAALKAENAVLREENTERRYAEFRARADGWIMLLAGLGIGAALAVLAVAIFVLPHCG